jgi:hypothetical protein
MAASAGQPPLRASHWLAAAALAVLAVIAAEALHSSPQRLPPAAPLDPAGLQPGFGPATFAEALGFTDREVAAARRQAERHAGEWLRLEALARALAGRFRLTADPGDLAEAGRLLDRALGLAPYPAGPALSQAEVSLAMHDLAGAERALARFDAAALPTPADLAEAASIRCEIAIERGRLTEARKLCGGEALSLELRRANLAAKTGETEAAARIVETALRRPRLPPASLATLELQRASIALAEGDWDASRRWAGAAERAFPGYWLSEAFVAQQYALEGDRAEARRRFATVAERTGNPDVLDVLARLAEADGNAVQARGWAARAGEAWEQRARALPLTYAAHHAEHLLLYGDRRRALALAAADHRRRSHAPTLAHYAFALWRTGDAARALEVVSAGEERGFLTADMKLAEALALGSLGRAAQAGEALAEARRLNPRIDSAAQQYVVFGRD